VTDARDVRYWQSMQFQDVDAMIGFLEAIGFREHAIHRDEQEPATVLHAEFVWEGGGGLMFGSVRDDALGVAGNSAAYLIAPDPDALFDRAVAAGATVAAPMVDQDYGGRGGSVRDPEGNLWSFGSYQPS